MKHFSKQKLISNKQLEHTYFAIDEKEILDIISNLLSAKNYIISEKMENKVSFQKGNKYLGRLLGATAHFHAVEIVAKAEMNGFLKLRVNHINNPLFKTRNNRLKVEHEINSISQLLQTF